MGDREIALDIGTLNGRIPPAYVRSTVGASRSWAGTPKFAVTLTLIYVHLWVVEGALRKWVPGTEQVLYVARDSITIVGLASGILFVHVKKKKTGLWLYLFGLLITVFCGVQIIIGLIPVDVGLVGLRSYIAPLLLVYIAWCYGCSDLLRKMASTILYYAPVELVIAGIQVLSDRASWINKEVGTDAAYFVNGDVVRASGTFSAPAGLTLYVPLCFAVCLWAVHQTGSSLKWLAIIGLTCASVVTAISGARGTVLSVCIVLVVYIICQLCSMRGSGAKNIMLITAFAVAVYFIALAIFPDVFSSFATRFDNAARSEDSTERITSLIFDFATAPLSLLGDGAGSHSMAGIALGTSGPWIETESLRWAAELGLMGWLLAALRIVVSLGATLVLLVRLPRLPMISVLITACLIPVILYGPITQFPSAQAFFSVCLSMLIVSLRPVGVLTAPADTKQLPASGA